MWTRLILEGSPCGLRLKDAANDVLLFLWALLPCNQVRDPVWGRLKDRLALPGISRAFKGSGCFFAAQKGQR